MEGEREGKWRERKREGEEGRMEKEGGGEGRQGEEEGGMREKGYNLLLRAPGGMVSTLTSATL